jgi:hypothetical protein
VNTYTELIDKHKGEVAFILGAGPSLYDLCKSHHFFDILDDVVISVNSAFMPLAKFELDPEKHYWVSNDTLCRRWSYWKDVEKSSCMKVVRDSWSKYKKVMTNTLYFSPRPTSEGVVNPKDTGLCYCSSIPTSIDLAIQMGCKKIFLFGVDHNDSSGRHHFWQLLYDRKNRPTANANIYDSWRKQQKVFEFNKQALKALRKFADSKRVEIYNCSNMSKVNSFDRISIDYAFKIIGKTNE